MPTLNRMEAETDYQDIVANNRFNVMVLHQFNKKICNGTTSSITEGVMGSMAEASHNIDQR